MADDKKIIFSMVGVSKIIPPSRQILKDIYLSFFYGAKIGIIGHNGSGKSTLLKIIAGKDKSYNGEVVFSPGYSVGMLDQDPILDNNKTVKEIVEEGVQEIVDIVKAYEKVNERFMEPMSDDEMNALVEEQGRLTELIEQHDAWELDNKLQRAMDALNCPDGDTPVKNLSGGERRRVALVRLLLQEPDILLLDEPTNHLDAEAIDWLEKHLQQYKGTVIAVTHGDTIIRKFKRAVTDSDTKICAGEGKEGITNLLSIYCAASGKCLCDAEKEFDGKGYGDFKLAVGECVADMLEPIHAEYTRLIADKKYLEDVMAKGAAEASHDAFRTLSKVKRKVGFTEIKR